MVQVYTGDGKGKTSAAMGAVLRAAGQGLRVCVIQFMKAGAVPGEVKALAALPAQVQVYRFGKKPKPGEDFAWVDPKNPAEEDLQEAREAFECAKKAITSDEHDLVVLDEVNVASAWGLIRKEDVLKLLDEKPERVEIILTGRGASQELLARANLVTEMVCVKHPFEQGAPVRKGIDI